MSPSQGLMAAHSEPNTSAELLLARAPGHIAKPVG